MDKLPSHTVSCDLSGKQTGAATERWFAKRARTEDEGAGGASCSEPFLRHTDTLRPAEGGNGTSLGDDDADDEGSTSYVVQRISPFLSETEPYILDVDLDFFSCKNPFKELYTEVTHSYTALMFEF